MESVFTPRATSLNLTAEQWETVADALGLLADRHESQEAYYAADYCRDLAEIVTASATSTEHECITCRRAGLPLVNGLCLSCRNDARPTPAPVRATRRRFAFRQADTVRLIKSLTESLLHQAPTEITLYEHPAVGRAEFMVDGSPAAFADEIQA